MIFFVISSEQSERVCLFLLKQAVYKNLFTLGKINFLSFLIPFSESLTSTIQKVFFFKIVFMFFILVNFLQSRPFCFYFYGQIWLNFSFTSHYIRTRRKSYSNLKKKHSFLLFSNDYGRNIL